MTIRKSQRTRTLTEKVKPIRQTTNSLEHPAKKRKLNVEEDADKIDPVEKLLSLTNLNNDILNVDEPSPVNYMNIASNNSTEQISLNFTKILNDNLRAYYSRLNKNPLEVYNDNSTFGLLNKQPTAEVDQETAPKHLDVPFFKKVNFNSNSKSYTFDEYLSYDDLTDTDESDEDKSPITPISLPPPLNGKMSFHYRHNDNLNLSLNQHPESEPQDICKILNKNCLISGKASEMVGTGNFMINDFFL